MRACARCGQPGHYAPTCPAPAPLRSQVVAAKPARPATKAPAPRAPKPAKRPRREPPVYVPQVFAPPADRPYHHVSREQHGPGEPDLPGYVHTWRHVTTGEEIVATFPPFSWERNDGMVVLRHLRDVAHARKHCRTATVEVRAAAARVA